MPPRRWHLHAQLADSAPTPGPGAGDRPLVDASAGEAQRRDASAVPRPAPGLKTRVERPRARREATHRPVILQITHKKTATFE